MILIQKVANYNEIQSMAVPNAILNIYELVENSEHERIFEPCTIEKPGWLDKWTGKCQLPSHYYISPASFSVVMEREVSHQGYQDGTLALTLELEVKLDVLHSDSGKGLADWLEEKGNIVDDTIMKSFVQEKLTNGFLESTLGLGGKPYKELRGGQLCFGAEAFRNVLPHWLSVEKCRVSNAVDKKTETTIQREEYLRRLAEIERQHTEKLAEKNREMELQAAEIEKQKLANELAKLKAEGESIENSRRMAMLRTAYDSIHGDRRSNAIEGEPFIAERLVMEINDVRLELESKRDVVLGRTKSTADVSMAIPEGCMDESKRVALCGNISKKHARLTHLGGAVRVMAMPRRSSVQNPTTMTSTYLGEETVTLDGKMLTKDTDLGISSDILWKCRVQKEDDGGVEKILSLVLNHPACNWVYKIFVWPDCRLKAVDPRLPDWRISYQAGAHGSEGAFYVRTSAGRCVYLKPGQAVVEDVPVNFVKD